MDAKDGDMRCRGCKAVAGFSQLSGQSGQQLHAIPAKLHVHSTLQPSYRQSYESSRL